MTGFSSDPFKLHRFVEAQRGSYERALAELRAGRKAGHWMWFILPQLKGLGFSHASQFYGLSGLDEARAYVAHPILGPRLRDCVAAMLATDDVSAVDILGVTDAMKFHSSLTLFARAAPQEPLFEQALRKFFGGEADAATLGLLKARE